MEFLHGLYQENTHSHKELLIRFPQGSEKKYNRRNRLYRIC